MLEAERPLRRDAERNRQLLLATARALIAECGLDVGHEDIARAAGVGKGTVYRRFPDKQDLIDALFDEHIDAVVTLAEDARKASDPWEGLRRFMEGNLEMQARDRGLRELLRGSRQGSQLVRRARERITPAVGELVTRAQAAGALTENIAPGDFVLVELMVTGVMDAARSFDPDLWRRALAVALAGLCDGQALPGAPPDAEAIDRLHGGGGDKPKTRQDSPGESRGPLSPHR